VGWQVVNVVVLHAGNTIINPNGIFVYDGAPAAGNLIIALAPAAGTDQFANAFIKGILIGEPTDSAQIQLVPGGGGPAKLLFPLPSLSLSNIANVSGGTSGAAGTLIFSGAALATVDSGTGCRSSRSPTTPAARMPGWNSGTSATRGLCR